MEQHLSVLTQALNKANQAGAFNLNEATLVSQALSYVTQFVKGAERAQEIQRERNKSVERDNLNAQLRARDLSEDSPNLTPVEELESNQEMSKSNSDL